jgi:hypothetical protein
VWILDPRTHSLHEIALKPSSRDSLVECKSIKRHSVVILRKMFHGRVVSPHALPPTPFASDCITVPLPSLYQHFVSHYLSSPEQSQ